MVRFWLRLNAIGTKIFRVFDNWLILEPTKSSCKAFSPSILFIGETKIENRIELYTSLLWISEFAVNHLDFQSKYMRSNHRDDNDKSKASRDITTSI